MNTKKLTTISICILVACFAMVGIFAYVFANNNNDTATFEPAENENSQISDADNETDETQNQDDDAVITFLGKPLSEAPLEIQYMVNTYFVDADGKQITSLRTDDYYKDWDGYYEKMLRACKKQWDELSEEIQNMKINDYARTHSRPADMTDEEFLERVIIYSGTFADGFGFYLTRINDVLDGICPKYGPKPDIEKIREWSAGIRARDSKSIERDQGYICEAFMHLAFCNNEFSIGSGNPIYFVAIDDTLRKFVRCGGIATPIMYYEFDETYENCCLENLITGEITTYNVEEHTKTARENIPPNTVTFSFSVIMKSLFG